MNLTKLIASIKKLLPAFLRNDNQTPEQKKDQQAVASNTHS